MTEVRVLQCITRMIVGGAQETVLLYADYLRHVDRGVHYSIDVVTGPDTGPEGDLKPEYDRRSITCSIIPELSNPIRPLPDVQTIWKLVRHIRRGRYDIVHTHSTKAGILGRVAARIAGVKVIVHTVHGWGFHDHAGRGRRGLMHIEKLLAERTSALIAVASSDIRKGLDARIGREAQYRLIRSGIELNHFGKVDESSRAIREELGIPGEALVVGSVMRLSPQKAPLDFVKAAALVHARHPDVYFLVVGDGRMRTEVQALIESYGLDDRVVLTGLRRDVARMLKAMDVFVTTSLWEGLPRTLPQAMASGLGIVATRADGNVEAVVDGVNGYLVDCGDVRGVADRICMLVADSELREMMGANGRAQAVEFSAERMVEQLDVLYRELLGKA